jgi:hypothetical protein
MRKRKWTVDQLTSAIKQSRSFRQVLLLLDLKPAGGNYDQIRKYTKEYAIDTTHFVGKLWNKGLKAVGKPRIELNDILKIGSTYQSFKLKQRLFTSGLKPMYCEECTWAQRTEDGYLPLELDHINGDRHDNRLENLRVLCPNCHSLKPTHRGRNINKKKNL